MMELLLAQMEFVLYLVRGQDYGGIKLFCEVSVQRIRYLDTEFGRCMPNS